MRSAPPRQGQTRTGRTACSRWPRQLPYPVIGVCGCRSVSGMCVCRAGAECAECATVDREEPGFSRASGSLRVPHGQDDGNDEDLQRLRQVR